MSAPWPNGDHMRLIALTTEEAATVERVHGWHEGALQRRTDAELASFPCSYSDLLALVDRALDERVFGVQP